MTISAGVYRLKNTAKSILEGVAIAYSYIFVIGLLTVFIVSATGGAARKAPPGDGLVPRLVPHNPIEAAWFGIARWVAISGWSFGYLNRSVIPYLAWCYVVTPLLFLVILAPVAPTAYRWVMGRRSSGT